MSIAKFSTAPDPAAYYLEVIANERDDYYLESGEVAGRWMGSASAHLGLAGAVEPDDLRAVLEGRDPRTGDELTGWRKIPGFDLTLSAPKSVSLLWALGDQEIADAVVAAHDTAVEAAIAYLEEEACIVRRGRGGATHLTGAGLVSATFRHRTSREADPSLHTHLVTPNFSFGPDGRWTALHTPEIWRRSRPAGFVYQSVLRHEIVRRVDLSFEPSTTPGVGEIVGIPTKIRRAFSRRREAIEKSMAEHGVRSPQGAQVATLATRPAKPAPRSEVELRVDWAERAAEIGFDLTHVRRGHRVNILLGDAELGRELTVKNSTFDRRDVVQAVAETATQGLTYDQIRDRVDGFLAGTEVIDANADLWTTPEMLAIEADAIDRATHGGPTVAVDPAIVEEAIAARPSISGEQAEAVKVITTSDAPVAVLVGHAGTGKTFTFDAAHEAWRRAGLNVRGAALAARAAKGLEAGSGIPSETIAKLIKRLDEGLVLNDRDVVVVDEAGMVGTRDLHRLLVATTNARAKLVLAGDHKQLAEIEAGGLFAVLGHRIGCVELTENRRLRSPAQQETARALRDRKVDQAILRLHRTGSITTNPNSDKLRDGIAEDWFLERNDGKHAVMLALHRSDVADLNGRARKLLRSNGQLGEQLLSTYDIELCAGDRVVALRNDRRIGITNGTPATVTGRTGPNLHLETDSGERLDLPVRYAVEGHLAHGYAMTVHKSQGMTCDVSLVLGDESLYVEAGYTAITRGSIRNHVYAVETPDDRDPVAQLRRALDHTAAKRTAVEQTGLGL